MVGALKNRRSISGPEMTKWKLITPKESFSIFPPILAKSNATAYRINIPHLLFTSHFPPDILDSIIRKSNRLRLKVVTKVNGKDGLLSLSHSQVYQFGKLYQACSLQKNSFSERNC